MSRDLPVPSCAECALIGIPVPPLLARMEAELGAETLRAFLLDRGGRELAVSRTGEHATEAHPAICDWLRHEVGFGKMVVPKGPTARRARLAWAIYESLRAGQSLAVVACALDLHSRTVSTHKRRLARRGLLTDRKDQP